jgi:DNA-3-methyladenine glycosylase
MLLTLDFFERNAEIVARELVGCTLVRKIDGKELRCLVEEVEAYLDESRDPAVSYKTSRNKRWREIVRLPPGSIYVYSVFGNKLFNIVAHEKNSAGMVFIRRCRALNFSADLSTPSKVTSFLKIDESLNFKRVLSRESGIFFERSERSYRVKSYMRIGIKKEYNLKLRFVLSESRTSTSLLFPR